MELTAHFEDHKSVIFDELQLAQKEVIIAVAWINFKEYFAIFDSLLDRKVLLKIICSDNPQNRAHNSWIKTLVGKGAQIKLLQMPTTRNHMHHKFAVVDSKVLINGSFNWSPNAEKSLENLIVVKDCLSEILKFTQEFDKILKIEKATMEQLQKKVKCKDCGGEILNILVFSEYSNYYETFGDIIAVCNQCFEFVPIEEGISDTQLYILANNLAATGDDYDYEYLDKLMTDALNSYVNSLTTLHGIGKVKSGLNGFDEDYTNTDIVWKNKFVGDRLPETFHDQNFDVVYDN